MESALDALEQAKAKIANEKKKQNDRKRKAENHHKYMLGGIVTKYFLKCYSFDEQELNRILSTALHNRKGHDTVITIQAGNRSQLQCRETDCHRLQNDSLNRLGQGGHAETGQACRRLPRHIQTDRADQH